MFNLEAIQNIKSRLKSKSNQPSTEEATKQWLVIPLLVALGYDPYSSDIVPEYVSDVGTKRGEKVDYMIQVNNQPVAIIECKQLNCALSSKYADQLYRYFTVSDVHIAILTNGDEYWFFTDSQKENIMDLEPYYTLKLSTATDEELEKLNMYSSELIEYTDMASLVKYEKFQNECKELAVGLRYNKIPTWLIDVIIERSGGGITEISKPTLAEYLGGEVSAVFDGFKAEKVEKKRNALGDKIKKTRENNKKNISKIKLNYEYVYNDYSDGDWKYHKINYAVILGKKYENISAKGLLVNTFEQLVKKKHIKIKEIVKREEFNGMFKIGVGQGEGVRAAYYFPEWDTYISTSYGISHIIKFIESLLRYANLDDSVVKISFKE